MALKLYNSSTTAISADSDIANGSVLLALDVSSMEVINAANMMSQDSE